MTKSPCLSVSSWVFVAALLLDATASADTPSTTQQPDVLGGVLEISVTLSVNAPSSLTVSFPALGSYPATSYLLSRQAESRLPHVGIYRKTISPSTTVPFVNHPDQWDRMVISAATPTQNFEIESLKVTHQVLFDGGRFSKPYLLIFTSGQTYPSGAVWSNWTPAIWTLDHWDQEPLDLDSTLPDHHLPITPGSTGWSFDLKAEIERRRQFSLERLIYYSSEQSVSMAATEMPRIIQEIASDTAQPGSIKLVNGAGVAQCATNQMYYQCNFAHDILVDFAGYNFCANDGVKTWATGGAPDAWPVGPQAFWQNAFTNKDRTRGGMGMVQWTGVGDRDELDPSYPIVQVKPAGGSSDHPELGIWVPQGVRFETRPGDMFYRHEWCWGEGYVKPAPETDHEVGSIFHAMTLLGSIRQKQVTRQVERTTTTLPQIAVPIWDSEIQEFTEPSEWMKEKVYADSFDTTDSHDTNNDDCVEPWEVTPNPVPYYQPVYTGKSCRYCGRYLGQPTTDCPDSKLFCPRRPFDHKDRTQAAYYYRREYMIGESLYEPTPALTRVTMSGQIDTSFNGGHKLILRVPGASRAVIFAGAKQTDGKIVIAGGARTLAGTVFLVGRLTVDGKLDPTFADTGIALTDFAPTANESASAVAIDPSGNIVVAGTAGGQFAIARYSSAGRLDPNGKALTKFPGQVTATAQGIALAQGKIVVAGTVSDTSGRSQFAVARYLAPGTLDPGFNGNGMRLVDFTNSESEKAWALAIDNSSRIVVAGEAMVGSGATLDSQVAVARVLWSGQMDPTFDSDGKVLINFGSSGREFASSLLTDSSNRVVVGGSANGRFALSRVNANGTPDTSFGAGTSRVLTNFSGLSQQEIASIAFSNSDIVAVGRAYSLSGGWRFASAVYTSGGALKSSYNGIGMLVTDFPYARVDKAYAAVVTAGSSILMLGASGDDQDIP
jgi:uncharacterized delta-60 repeat protein